MLMEALPSSFAPLSFLLGEAIATDRKFTARSVDSARRGGVSAPISPVSRDAFGNRGSPLAPLTPGGVRSRGMSIFQSLRRDSSMDLGLGAVSPTRGGSVTANTTGYESPFTFHDCMSVLVTVLVACVRAREAGCSMTAFMVSVDPKRLMVKRLNESQHVSIMRLTDRRGSGRAGATSVSSHWPQPNHGVIKVETGAVRMSQVSRSGLMYSVLVPDGDSHSGRVVIGGLSDLASTGDTEVVESTSDKAAEAAKNGGRGVKLKVCISKKDAACHSAVVTYLQRYLAISEDVLFSVYASPQEVLYWNQRMQEYRASLHSVSSGTLDKGVPLKREGSRFFNWRSNSRTSEADLLASGSQSLALLMKSAHEPIPVIDGLDVEAAVVWRVGVILWEMMTGQHPVLVPVGTSTANEHTPAFGRKRSKRGGAGSRSGSTGADWRSRLGIRTSDVGDSWASSLNNPSSPLSTHSMSVGASSEPRKRGMFKRDDSAGDLCDELPSVDMVDLKTMHDGKTKRRKWWKWKSNNGRLQKWYAHSSASASQPRLRPPKLSIGGTILDGTPPPAPLTVGGVAPHRDGIFSGELDAAVALQQKWQGDVSSDCRSSNGTPGSEGRTPSDSSGLFKRWISKRKGGDHHGSEDVDGVDTFERLLCAFDGRDDTLRFEAMSKACHSRFGLFLVGLVTMLLGSSGQSRPRAMDILNMKTVRDWTAEHMPQLILPQTASHGTNVAANAAQDATLDGAATASKAENKGISVSTRAIAAGLSDEAVDDLREVAALRARARAAQCAKREDILKMDFADVVAVATLDSSPAAMGVLAQWFLEGTDIVKQSYPLAEKWAKRGSVVQDVPSFYVLGYLAEIGQLEGCGVADAVKYYAHCARTSHSGAVYRLACIYDTKRMGQATPEMIYSLFERAAGFGSARAALATGQKLEVGDGVQPHVYKSAQYYKKALDLVSDRDVQTRKEVLRSLGRVFGTKYTVTDMMPHVDSTMEVIERDVPLACQYYSKAGELGDAEALCAMGKMLMDEVKSLSVAEGFDDIRNNCMCANMVSAFEAFSRAAELNNLEAIELLAQCYLWGAGTRASADDAVLWYQRGADAGSADCATNAGCMFLRGYGSVPVNRALAYKYFNMAKKTRTIAMANLAFMYEHGFGCERSSKQAMKMYKTAVSEAPNEGVHHYNMGAIFLAGLCGVGMSKQLAMKHLQSAARLKERRADLVLGFVHEAGHGAAPNLGTAVRHYVAASEGGSIEALFRLGVLCLDKDRPCVSKARGYFEVAADVGHSKSMDALRTLGLRDEYTDEVCYFATVTCKLTHYWLREVNTVQPLPDVLTSPEAAAHYEPGPPGGASDDAKQKGSNRDAYDEDAEVLFPGSRRGSAYGAEGERRGSSSGSDGERDYGGSRRGSRVRSGSAGRSESYTIERRESAFGTVVEVVAPTQPRKESWLGAEVATLEQQSTELELHESQVLAERKLSKSANLSRGHWEATPRSASSIGRETSSTRRSDTTGRRASGMTDEADSDVVRLTVPDARLSASSPSVSGKNLAAMAYGSPRRRRRKATLGSHDGGQDSMLSGLALVPLGDGDGNGACDGDQDLSQMEKLSMSPPLPPNRSHELRAKRGHSSYTDTPMSPNRDASQKRSSSTSRWRSALMPIPETHVVEPRTGVISLDRIPSPLEGRRRSSSRHPRRSSNSRKKDDRRQRQSRW